MKKLYDSEANMLFRALANNSNGYYEKEVVIDLRKKKLFSIQLITFFYWSILYKLKIIKYVIKSIMKQEKARFA